MTPLRFRQWLHPSQKFHCWGTGDEGKSFTSPCDRNVSGAPHEESQQSTGLHDKNGKEIFEGDIVTNGMTSGGVRYVLGGFTVEDDPEYGGCCPILAFNGRQRDFPNDLLKKVEVIGNIHENPELLPAAA